MLIALLPPHSPPTASHHGRRLCPGVVDGCPRRPREEPSQGLEARTEAHKDAQRHILGTWTEGIQGVTEAPAQLLK